MTFNGPTIYQHSLGVTTLTPTSPTSYTATTDIANFPQDHSAAATATIKNLSTNTTTTAPITRHADHTASFVFQANVPANAASIEYEITVTNGNATPQIVRVKPYNRTVPIWKPIPTQQATVGTPSSFKISDYNDVSKPIPGATYTYTVEDALPAGLSFDGTDKITGTPTTPGTTTVELVCTRTLPDNQGTVSSTTTVTYKVEAANVPAPVLGTPHATLSGSQGNIYNVSVTVTNMPTGARAEIRTMDNTKIKDGTISGSTINFSGITVPADQQSITVKIVLIDQDGKEYTSEPITPSNVIPPTWKTIPAQQATVGTLSTLNLPDYNNNTPPIPGVTYSYSIVGTVPGANISTSNQLRYTPSSAGTQSITVRMTRATGDPQTPQVSKDYTITYTVKEKEAPAPVLGTPQVAPSNGSQGDTYDISVSVTNLPSGARAELRSGTTKLLDGTISGSKINFTNVVVPADQQSITVKIVLIANTKEYTSNEVGLYNELVPVWNANFPTSLEGQVGKALNITLTNAVDNPNKGTLVFSKVAGPSWINITPVGALSGTPDEESPVDGFALEIGVARILPAGASASQTAIITSPVIKVIITKEPDNPSPAIEVVVYPNPFTETLHVDVDADMNLSSYFIYDSKGNLVDQGVLQVGPNTIDVSKLPHGFFALKLTDRSGKSKTVKVVK